MHCRRVVAIQLCWTLAFGFPFVTSQVASMEEGKSGDTVVGSSANDAKKTFFDLGGIGLPLGFQPAQEPQRPSPRTSIMKTPTLTSSTTQRPLRVTSSSQVVSRTPSQIPLRPAVTTPALRSLSASSTSSTSTTSSTSSASSSSARTAVVSSSMLADAVVPPITKAQPTAVSSQSLTPDVSGQGVLASSPSPSEAENSGAIPVLPDENESIGPMGQLGISFGITFAVLAIAAAVAITIWYRRRHRRPNVENKDSPGSTGPARFNPAALIRGYIDRRKTSTNTEDPEWSIESAERVSIVKNMQAHSVSTIPRSSSRGSNQSSENGVIKIATRLRPTGPALTSHPITPGATKFPARPFDADAEGDVMDEREMEKKPSQWPLSK